MSWGYCRQEYKQGAVSRLFQGPRWEMEVDWTRMWRLGHGDGEK